MGGENTAEGSFPAVLGDEKTIIKNGGRHYQRRQLGQHNTRFNHSTFSGSKIDLFDA